MARRCLQGLSLKNVRVTAKVGKKTIYSELGEMLFHAFRRERPADDRAEQPRAGGLSRRSAVTLDMKPGLTEEQVDLRLQRDFAENIRKQLSSVLTGLMPARMAPVFAKLCGVDADTPINQVTREQRLAIGRALKALPLRVVGTRPIEGGHRHAGRRRCAGNYAGHDDEQEDARGCSWRARCWMCGCAYRRVQPANCIPTGALARERRGVVDGAIKGYQKGQLRAVLSDCRQKAILPRRGRIALSANEGIAEFLDFAIQAKFAYANKLKG